MIQKVKFSKREEAAKNNRPDEIQKRQLVF